MLVKIYIRNVNINLGLGFIALTDVKDYPLNSYESTKTV